MDHAEQEKAGLERAKQEHTNQVPTQHECAKPEHSRQDQRSS